MRYHSKDGWRLSLTENLGRAGLVILVIFLLLLLSLFPLRLHGYGEVRPFFMLMAVYYWAIFRPTLLPPTATFVAGLVLDLAIAVPVGLNALTLVGVRTLTSLQQKFMLSQKFVVMWACFALVAFGAALFQWGVFCLLNWQVTAFKPSAISALLTALLFPAVALPLYIVNRALDDRDLFR